MQCDFIVHALRDRRSASRRDGGAHGVSSIVDAAQQQSGRPGANRVHHRR
jgi:hypothetical protein